MVSLRFVLRFFCGLALATAAFAQAAVEYAAKSSTSALGGTSGGARLGACTVDETFVTCVRQSYPLVFYAATVAVCIFVLTLVFRQGRRV